MVDVQLVSCTKERTAWNVPW